MQTLCYQIDASVAQKEKRKCLGYRKCFPRPVEAFNKILIMLNPPLATHCKLRT